MGKRNKAQSVNFSHSKGDEESKFSNGLGEAVGFNGAAMGMPNAFGGGNAQIAKADTIQDTLRNYLITNNRQLLSQAYVEIGLVQTVIDVPVDDALRGGLIIKSKQISEKEITELHATMDDEGDLEVLGQAEKWNRLFGGAGVIALTDQDPESPLDMDALQVGDPLAFKAADMWELYYTQADTDEEERSIEVEWSDDPFFNFYGCDLDPSRVFKLKGKRPPSFLRGRVRGWGISEVENLIRSINQYLKATDLGFEVLDEFKLDIYKFKGLSAQLMGPGGTAKVQQRVAIANYTKNYQNAIVLDADDDYDHKQLSFAGLAEAMSGIRMQVASDLRIPISKLFGIAATGFSSGEDDIEVYNSMIESTVRSRIKRPALKMVKLRCQQLFGFIPDDLTIEFKPLRMLSAEQEETIKEKKFNRLLQARQAGEISVLEFRNAVNRDNLLGIQLDVTDESILPDDADQVGATQSPPGGDENFDEGDDEGVDGGKVIKGDFGDPKPKPIRLANTGFEQPVLTTTQIMQAKKSKGRRKKDKKKRPSLSAVPQKLFVMPKAYSAGDNLKRMLNSADFDRASYEADGGDGWIDSRRQLFFDRDKALDKGRWDHAEERSKEIFGSPRWQFTVWFYKKLGGSF